MQRRTSLVWVVSFLVTLVGCATQGSATPGRATEALATAPLEATLAPSIATDAIREFAFRGDLLATAGPEALYVFERGTSGWGQIARIPGAFGDVAISGNTVVVSSPGTDSVLVYVRGASGITLQATLVAPPPPPLPAGAVVLVNRIGGAVAIDGDLVATSYGLLVDRDPDREIGNVIVFRRTGDTWDVAALDFGYIVNGSTEHVVGIAGSRAIGVYNLICDEHSGLVHEFDVPPPGSSPVVPRGGGGGCIVDPGESPHRLVGAMQFDDRVQRVLPGSFPSFPCPLSGPRYRATFGFSRAFSIDGTTCVTGVADMRPSEDPIDHFPDEAPASLFVYRDGHREMLLYPTEPVADFTLGDSTTLAALLRRPTGDVIELRQLVRTLGTFEVTVTGEGRVVSDPPGIDCGMGATDCSEPFPYGTDIVLRATSAPGWSFEGYGEPDGWGPCWGWIAACEVRTGPYDSAHALFAPLAAPGATCTFPADCASGVCVGRVCCAGTCAACGTCEASTGACVPVASTTVCRGALYAMCDVAEHCDGISTACPSDVTINEGMPCDFTGMCTVSATCGAGRCVREPVDCDDADPCTRDSCLWSSGCTHTPIARCCRSDAECDDDGDACTEDVCQADRCAHPAIAGCCATDADCSPATCATSACVESTCLDTPIAGCCVDVGDCDDGDPCTSDECTTSSCTHTRSPTCGDAGGSVEIDGGASDAGALLDGGAPPDAALPAFDASAGPADAGSPDPGGGCAVGVGGHLDLPAALALLAFAIFIRRRRVLRVHRAAYYVRQLP